MGSTRRDTMPKSTDNRNRKLSNNQKKGMLATNKGLAMPTGKSSTKKYASKKLRKVISHRQMEIAGLK